MFNAIFHTPDLTTFCDLDDLGLTATDQGLTPGRAVIECSVTIPDPVVASALSRKK